MVVSPTSSAYIEDVDTPAVALKIPPMETIPEMEFIEEINNEDDDDNISVNDLVVDINVHMLFITRRGQLTAH